MKYARLLFCLAITLTFIFCQTRESTTLEKIEYSELIKDYFSNSPEWEIFREADSLKWGRDYLAAAAVFEQVLNSGEKLKRETHAYGLNQLAYCYLNIDQEEKAIFYLQELEKDTTRHNKNTKADYLFNKGQYLMAVDSGELAIPYLNEADSLYFQIYGDSHLRRLQALTARGNAYRFYTEDFNTAAVYVKEAMGMLEKDSVFFPYAAHAYLAKANIVRERRRYMDGLSYSNIALGHSKGGS